MTTINEILEWLRNGETVEDIGNDFAALLNNAKAAYDQEERKKAERAQFASEKRYKLIFIIKSFANWYDKYVQELNEDINAEELADEFIKVLDTVNDTVTNLNNTVNKLYNYANLDNQKKKEDKAADLGDDIDLQRLVDMFLGQ